MNTPMQGRDSRDMHALLHLSLVSGVGHAYTKMVIDQVQQLGCTINDIYQWQYAQFRAAGLPEKLSHTVVAELQDMRLVEKELELCSLHAVNLVFYGQAGYPAALAAITVPPPVLYIRGQLDLFQLPMVAIVGSRLSDAYGRSVIQSLVPSLVHHSVVIVSGGAIGADTMAHEETVTAGGKTIVVCGSGLLYPYPQCNKGLFQRVVDGGGMLLSTFALRTPAHPGNFPARNRIISGLSAAVIVVQAARKSGACITAHYALEQGRDVGAVPGRVGDPLSEGCHELLKTGAAVITTAADILPLVGMNPSVLETDQPVAELSGSQRFVQQQIVILTRSFQTPIHEDVYKRCSMPSTMSDLLNQLAIPLSELGSILFELQCDGFVQQDHLGRWSQI